MNTFCDLISEFESCEALAKELGVTVLRVRAWRRRNSIPAFYWPGVIAAARKHAEAKPKLSGVTLELLVGFTTPKPPNPVRAA